MPTNAAPWRNKLYFGDNLDILRDYVQDATVDLIYLDPPFNSNATYNVLFQEKSGERSAAQITAFDDTWHWGEEPEYAYQDVVTHGPKKLADLLQAMRSFLGQNDMMAYLTMMAQRMVELHRVLEPTGSIYLHCDPTASHYLKLLMDAVFGARNFRNEIVWQRFKFHADAHRFGRVTDRLLFFTKSDRFTFNSLRRPFSDEYTASKFTHTDADGRAFRLSDLNPPGGRGPVYEFNGVTKPWRFTKEKMRELDRQGYIYKGSKVAQLKRYLDKLEGQAVHKLFDDLAPINPMAKERLGYPTQKPEALLERIIRASSNEGDLVLDPFCGCGTTVAVAERLKRRWTGIDITHLAITLMKNRLLDAFGPDLSPYEVVGAPQDLASARALAQESAHDGRYQFEHWALGLVDARPAYDKRKGADRGVDGYINFFDDNSGRAKTVVVQVKSGHVNAAHVRDLKGVLEREKAPIGVLVTLEPPTRPMLQEAIAAGFYSPDHFPELRYPKLQILTIEQLLAGHIVQHPRLAPAATFKRAQRRRATPASERLL